jgi:hypothetical protein
MSGPLEAKPVVLDEAVKKLLSGLMVRSLEQPFYRGGAIYGHAIDTPDGAETRIVSAFTWKSLSRWTEKNGQRALLKRANGSYSVRGKSGMTAGHLWKAKDVWLLQMHASPPESFSTAKAAKAAALEAALRY